MSNEKGQLSIFFGTTMIVVVGLIAFIINIGYFVKAKINLQNAVDAAAYAGASVQARQLTNIAYLNWEMRNVYKEWMFKYYVLGNLNTDAVQSTSGSTSDFTMKNLDRSLVSEGGDKYNVPSICVDFSNTGDVGICRNYKVPGLPRFEAYDVQGMTETTNAIIDAIVSEKNGDCAKRSALNYSTATLWAYNIVPKEGSSSSLISDSPQIATNRPGAFPAAFELAIRMRNLEAQVNKAPYSSGVCAQSGPLCRTTIDEIMGTGSIADERISKAFMSAWRNLGGLAPNDLLKSSFTLKELEPSEPNTGSSEYNLSNLLIPSGPGRIKHYLDLKLQTVNFATFYTAFVSQIDTSTNTPKEGECEATKVGLPVPGYPLGFVKNPNVLTYYAVKGEALFIGLFNPFEFGDGIRLTAVAAAKPFGGRIGPALFDVTGAQTSSVSPLISPNVSSGYAVGIKKVGSNVNEFTAGDPLPLGTFWQSNENEAIGGWVNGVTKFVMPNLIYDYPNGFGDNSNVFLATSPVNIQETSASTASLNAPGLYNGDIMRKLTANLGDLSGINPEKIDQGILSARAATEYDLKNYLVPTPESLNANLGVNSYGFILDADSSGSGNNSSDAVYNYNIYAPVFSDDPDVLYNNIDQIVGVLDQYILAQKPAIEQYVNSMKQTAAKIYSLNTSQESGDNTAVGAAATVADIPIEYMSNPLSEEAKVTCNSIAGKFAYFYTGDNDLALNTNGSCTTVNNLKDLLRSYWNENQQQLGNYYDGQYTIRNNGALPRKHFNAYNPNNGKDSKGGAFTNVMRPSEVNMIRNYYSTKLIPLKSLMGNSGGYSKNVNFAIFSNGSSSNESSSFKQEENSNALPSDSVSDAINH